ncbi:hypothetical protein [Kitasatospora sp. NPDC088134]|uniref:hypothetical protein n=1 Tax=Kitasatospora sp. NPDC088134 TaxID=3364071 RepID=UPI00380EE3FD
MSITSHSVRATGLLLAAGLVSGVALAAPAAASDSSNLQPLPNISVCTKGNYPAYLVFTDRGGLATRVAAANGGCASLYLSGRSSEHVTIKGIRPNGSSFTVGTDTFDDADGEHITVYGTPETNDWYAA